MNDQVREKVDRMDSSIMEQGEPPVRSTECSATGLRQELNTIIELAECGIANEKLGGNVCKEEHWKGQRFAATQVLQWLDAQSPNTDVSDRQPERNDDRTR